MTRGRSRSKTATGNSLTQDRGGHATSRAWASPTSSKYTWRKSPSPLESFENVDETKPLDWAFQIVGEEVAFDGDIKYETQWKDWHRNDSEKSNVTWDNRLLEQGHHKYWDNKQKKMRRRLAQTQTDMNLWSTLDPVQTETRLRAQAFQEKLQYARHDNETLADSTDSDSETSTSLVRRSASPEITATGEFKKKQVAPNLYVVYEAGDEWPFPRHFQYLEKGYISDIPDLYDRDVFISCSCAEDRRCDPESCECQTESKIFDERTGEKLFAYNSEGRFAFNTPPGHEVIECNKYCQCTLTTCPNRVSQQPRDVTIEIFQSLNGCGWGVRSSGFILQGTVLGMYTGELIYRNDASKLSKEDKEYCFDLDGHEDLDDQTRIGSSFTVNSKKIGNWTRFINHSCEPNLVIQSVVWEKIPEENKPFLVFVAKYDLEPFTELSIDYMCASGGVVYKKGKAKSPPSDATACLCGTSSCRQWIEIS